MKNAKKIKTDVNRQNFIYFEHNALKSHALQANFLKKIWQAWMHSNKGFPGRN